MLLQYLQVFRICRSTVDFAREVAENKTMDDALNRLEGMFTGADPREESVTMRRGDTSMKSGSFTGSISPPVKNEVSFTIDCHFSQIFGQREPLPIFSSTILMKLYVKAEKIWLTFRGLLIF